MKKGNKNDNLKKKTEELYLLLKMWSREKKGR